MLQYSLEVGICWAILYLVYITFLRRETFFSVNRWYLLGSLVLGLLIPVLRTIPMAFQEEAIVVNEALYFISAGPELIAANISVQPEVQTVFTLSNLLLLIYSLGLLVVGSRMIIGLLKIKNLYTRGDKTNKGSFILVETSQFHLPFSFLNCVFFSIEMPINDSIEKILKHELTHVQSWHTLDVLFTEVLQILFWFNPLIILYKKAIKESHEYVADASVLQDTSQKIYGQILLRQSQSGLQIALANHFFHSHIKNRLTMMKQKKSKWPAMIKYLFAVPAILLLMVLFQSQTLPDTQKGLDTETEIILSAETAYHPSLIPIRKKDLKVDIANASGFGMREHPVLKNKKKHLGIDLIADMNTPIYSASDGIISDAKFNKGYGNHIIIDHGGNYSTLYAHLSKYDVRRGERVIKGQPIGSVGSTGLSTIPHLHYEVRVNDKAVDPGPFLKEYIKIQTLDNVVEIKNDTVPPPPPLGEVWQEIEHNKSIGIKIDGRSVTREEAMELKGNLNLKTVGMHNPHARKIELVEFVTREVDHYEYVSGNPPIVKKIIDENKLDKEVFKVVQQMPRFPGCEEVEGTHLDREECAKKNMLEFIYTNLEYPKMAMVNGIEGTNVIQFIIEKNGRLSDLNLVRDIGGNTGEASLAVIEKMQTEYIWKPGFEKGKAVRVLYTLPIRFKLEGRMDNYAKKKLSFISNKENSEKEPLIILDGKEYVEDMSSITPDEIKEITVIKGEKAITEYGQKARNGVVLVTTEDGSYEVREIKVPNPKPVEITEGDIFRVVEEMPRFPGCENLNGTKAEIEECSKKELLQFIYKHLNYPKEAREAGIDGTAVVQFVIDKKGRVVNPKVVRDFEGMFEAPIMKIMDEMVKQQKIWTPGIQNGEAVNVLFTLPVKFILEQLDVKTGDQPSKAVKDQKLDDPNNIETWVTGLAPPKVLNALSTSTLSEVSVDYHTDEAGPVNISLFNVSGQLLKSKDLDVLQGKNESTIELNANVAGVYIVTVTQGKSRISRKIFLK